MRRSFPLPDRASALLFFLIHFSRYYIEPLSSQLPRVQRHLRARRPANEYRTIDYTPPWSRMPSRVAVFCAIVWCGSNLHFL
ncbi:hypothetical protein JB92DRAFT_3097340 [Gautieria morchelliformis]|nr:hypothetical protein JB92DRAFT_3097340 [Gautieria morchelliformis]